MNIYDEVLNDVKNFKEKLRDMDLIAEHLKQSNLTLEANIKNYHKEHMDSSAKNKESILEITNAVENLNNNNMKIISSLKEYLTNMIAKLKLVNTENVANINDVLVGNKQEYEVMFKKCNEITINNLDIMAKTSNEFQDTHKEMVIEIKSLIVAYENEVISILKKYDDNFNESIKILIDSNNSHEQNICNQMNEFYEKINFFIEHLNKIVNINKIQEAIEINSNKVDELLIKTSSYDKMNKRLFMIMFAFQFVSLIFIIILLVMLLNS